MHLPTLGALVTTSIAAKSWFAIALLVVWGFAAATRGTRGVRAAT